MHQLPHSTPALDRTTDVWESLQQIQVVQLVVAESSGRRGKILL